MLHSKRENIGLFHFPTPTPSQRAQYAISVEIPKAVLAHRKSVEKATMFLWNEGISETTFHLEILGIQSIL